MRASVQNVLLVGFVVLASGVACGGGGSDGNGGGGGPSLTIAKAGAPNGDGQSAVVGTAAADSLAVIVQEDGVPKVGATVTWSAQGTGAVVAPLTSVTDANGRAATRITIGTVVGAQTARATLAGATGSPVSFNLTALVGPAFSFVATAGDGQSALTAAPFANALSVKVGDSFGNGVPGVTVTWVVQSGSATVNGGATSVTNNLGVATKTITAGASAGAVTVRATNPAVPAVNLDFALTVTQPPVNVEFGNTYYQSVRNTSSNPAVDTTTVGRPVRWTSTGGTHSIESTGNPFFVSSGNLIGSGSTYSVTFNTPGTYEYDCGIHTTLMTGRVIVLP